MAAPLAHRPSEPAFHPRPTGHKSLPTNLQARHPPAGEGGYTMLTSEGAPVTAVEPHNERAIDLASVGVFRRWAGSCWLAALPGYRGVGGRDTWTRRLACRRTGGKPKLPLPHPLHPAHQTQGFSLNASPTVILNCVYTSSRNEANAVIFASSCSQAMHRLAPEPA